MTSTDPGQPPHACVWRRYRTLPALLLALLLGACGGTVVIEDDFPDPITRQLPYAVGVYYSPAFKSYYHEDEQESLNVQLGAKQVNLFNKVFTVMFRHLEPVGDPTQGIDKPQLDLILAPVLDQYAFLSPEQTATDFYTVSMKYHVQIYSNKGDLIGFFPFVAYGKNRSELMSRTEPLGDATVRALRDAAAALVSGFSDAIVTENWRPPADAPSTAQAAGGDNEP